MTLSSPAIYWGFGDTMEFIDSYRRKRFHRLNLDTTRQVVQQMNAFFLLGSSMNPEYMFGVQQGKESKRKDQLIQLCLVTVPFAFLESIFVINKECRMVTQCLRKISSSDMQGMFARTINAHLALLLYLSKSDKRFNRKAVEKFVPLGMKLFIRDLKYSTEVFLELLNGNPDPKERMTAMILAILPEGANRVLASELRLMSDYLDVKAFNALVDKLLSQESQVVEFIASENMLDGFK